MTRIPPTGETMQNLKIDPDDALFLDLDGTLIDLADTPSAVRVAPGLVGVLAALSRQLEGRLAIVSGRPIEQIDALLAPLVLPAAGVHGMQRRGADGTLFYAPLPSLAAARTCADALAASYPDVWVEEKYGALAVHFRQAPEAGPLCKAALAQVVRGTPDLLLMEGKMIVEVKVAGVDKGTAIAAFMAAAPFAGHRPVFFGDDTTDEAGFALVQGSGGIAIKVGAGPSVAQHRIGSAPALRAALAQLLDQ
ncbi:trehalose-phosphatase [Massilia sp. S19_KUP03_FR1]|uniref:trehalose-phosphatase n=1 Tax=Massilia sp. S19_KUP03_FR1 TaxID=3025503 RepID=UPI002FCDACD7